MTPVEQAAKDRATWPVKEVGNVMQCFRRGIALPVDEAETAALIGASLAPAFVPLDFGPHGVRLQPHRRAEPAWRKLAELRGERADGSC